MMYFILTTRNWNDIGGEAVIAINIRIYGFEQTRFVINSKCFSVRRKNRLVARS